MIVKNLGLAWFGLTISTFRLDRHADGPAVGNPRSAFFIYTDTLDFLIRSIFGLYSVDLGIIFALFSSMACSVSRDGDR